MAKKYSDRAMASAPVEQEFVFPKLGKVIKAKSREEAEKLLAKQNDHEQIDR